MGYEDLCADNSSTTLEYTPLLRGHSEIFNREV